MKPGYTEEKISLVIFNPAVLLKNSVEILIILYVHNDISMA